MAVRLDISKKTDAAPEFDHAEAHHRENAARATQDRARTGWLDRLRHRVEPRFIRLSIRSGFWYRLCTWITFPFAFRSGIRMRKVGGEVRTAELPFKRGNKNWSKTMAGAALLGNSEIAGGMYVMDRCRGTYR